MYFRNNILSLNYVRFSVASSIPSAVRARLSHSPVSLAWIRQQGRWVLGNLGCVLAGMLIAEGMEDTYIYVHSLNQNLASLLIKPFVFKTNIIYLCRALSGN